jgi:alkylation response protein AidB-like acyl-CoA dehydrogenase
MDPVSVASRLADDVLFPAALETDAGAVVPTELLDALADAGLYGLVGPASAGGMEADFPAVCGVIEALASGCLTTTFVWAQHVSALMAAVSSSNAAFQQWFGPMCAGEVRGGLALGGAMAGKPLLSAREAGNGFVIGGTSPFVSGWNRVDVLHAAARTEDGRLVSGFVDARETATLRARRVDLVALNATNTVAVTFSDHPLPAERITSVVPYAEGVTPPHVLRTHAAHALGVISRCTRLLGPTPLDRELEELRAELDRLDPETIQETRAVAGSLAIRAAAALMVSTGSRSLVRSEHAQRLAREALFCLVYALRPGSRDAALETLTGSRASTAPSG